MEAIEKTLVGVFNYLLTIRIPDIIDIVIVAYIIYKVLMLLRRANSKNVARGILVILLVLWLSDAFNLNMINYLSGKIVEFGLIALVVIFQPELRKFLEKVGRGDLRTYFIRERDIGIMDTVISAAVEACEEMSTERTGALIAFERAKSLKEYTANGTVINADLSVELLKNLFFINAPLHDGAVIVRDGKIAAAGCVLPLSKSKNLSKELGMRHRAGIGLSEESDAVVVIVSEETGSISIAEGGMLKRHLDRSNFEKILRSELIAEESPAGKQTFAEELRAKFTRKKDEENQS